MKTRYKAKASFLTALSWLLILVDLYSLRVSLRIISPSMITFSTSIKLSSCLVC